MAVEFNLLNMFKGSSLSSSSLRFPSDTSAHPVWTRISIYDINSTLSDADKKKLEKGSIAEQQTAVTALASGGNKNKTLATMTPKHVIYLYMPTGISINDTQAFDMSDLGVFGSMAEGVVDKVSGVEGTNKDVTGMGILKELGVAGGTALAKSGIPGVDAAVSRALIRAGIVSNPRTEMMYKAPTLRQFQFNYKLMPSSPAEAKTIANIIRIVRAASYPTITAGLGSVYQFPLTFKVEFVRNTGLISTKGASLDSMIKLPALYCTGVSTTYNPTSPAFFADGNPVEVDLALTFQEKEALDSEKIQKEGY